MKKDVLFRDEGLLGRAVFKEQLHDYQRSLTHCSILMSVLPKPALRHNVL